VSRHLENIQLIFVLASPAASIKESYQINYWMNTCSSHNNKPFTFLAGISRDWADGS